MFMDLVYAGQASDIVNPNSTPRVQDFCSEKNVRGLVIKHFKIKSLHCTETPAVDNSLVSCLFIAFWLLAL
jgi:hypothetical protein